MGFAAYLREGVEIANNAFNRFDGIYQQDQAKAIQASHQYQGTVTHQEIQGQVSKRIVDNAVEVLTVTDDIRAPKLDFWNQRSVQSLGLGISGLGFTAGGAAGAAAAKTFIVGGTAAVATPVAGVAVAVLGVAIAILGFYRYSQANEQYVAWQDPMAAHRAQRQRTDIEGFSYVFSHQLKGRLIHPEECRQLWFNWCDRDMPNYQQVNPERCYSPETVKQIKQFFKHNPLDVAAMEYAFTGVAPAPLNIQSLSTFFNQVKSAYSDVRAKAERERTKIDVERRRLIRQNEANREAWLAPAKLVRDSMNDEAYQRKLSQVKPYAATRDQKLHEIKQRFAKQEINLEEKNQQEAQAERIYTSHPAVIQAEEEYRSKSRKYQLLYDIASAPINAKFDGKGREIEAWAARQTDKVNRREDKQISHFARDVQGIAHAYVNAANYNRGQDELEAQEQLYPKLDLFNDLNQAYVLPQNPGVNAVELGQFMDQIYKQPTPSAPPLD